MATHVAGRSPATTQDQTPASPAETYERYMAPPLFAPAAARLLQAARPKPGDRVLDIGTGTGIVARLAAPRVAPGGSVAGLDLSPAMLSVARAASKREGVAIGWLEGQAESLPFAAGSFDLALSQFALMFFADRTAALREMRRVLAEGGRLALSVFQGIERHPFYVALDAAISRRLGESPVGAIFTLGDGDALRDEVIGAGFRDVTIEPFSITSRFPQPDAFLAGEIDVDTAAIPAMRGLAPEARRELAAAIAQEMSAPLRAVTEGDRVRLQFHARIACARR